jgi:hypothetical protein
MDSFHFYMNILINSAKFTKAFIDNGCLCYAFFNEFIIRALKLPRILIFLQIPEACGRKYERKKDICYHVRER